MSYVMKLIKLVRENPELYNHKSDGYADAVQRANKWKLIANILGKDPEVCKKRWRNLRDRYVRIKKNKAEQSHKKWEYLDQLSFLSNALNYESSSQKNTHLCLSDFYDSTNNTDDDLEFGIKHESADPLENPVHKITFRLSDNDETLVSQEPAFNKSFSDIEQGTVLNGFLEKLDHVLSNGLNSNNDDNDIMMRALALKMKPLPLEVKIKLQEQFLQEINKELLINNHHFT